MRKILCFYLLICLSYKAQTQSATFITLSNTDQLEQVTIGASGCTHSQLSLCTGTTGSPLSIALNGNILYIVDNQGFLYKTPLNSSGTCTNLGKFLSASTKIYGLTVDKNGKVYAANGSQIEVYNPNATPKFKIIGNVPATYKIGGDLLFYKGQLYMSCDNTTNALIKVDTLNPANSSLYLTFTSPSVFGFASVTVPCSNNQAYALSTSGSTTDIVGINMSTKLETGTVCTLPYKINDAASVAEPQSATPPLAPTVISPVNYCQNNPVAPLSATVASVNDTLRWYTQPVGGINTGSPIPAVSSSTLGTTTYYVSDFDTSTGCESTRDTIVVKVHPYPALPTINPTGTNTICNSSSLTLTSSAATGNQWLLNNVAISGAINQTYSATGTGNYAVIATTNAGCSKTSIATTVNVTSASIAYTGSPFCPLGTKSITLIGATGGKFSASPAGLVIDSVTGTLNLGLSQSGNYTISYTVGPANCVYTTSVTILSQTAGINYAPSTFCQANASVAVTFTPGSVTNGSFSFSPVGLSMNASGTINPAASALGSYTVTYTYGTAGVACGILNTTAIVNVTTGTISTTNISICPNQLPYSWNGLNFNAAGSQTKHLTNSVGCDSAATLNLTVNTPSTKIITLTGCNNINYKGTNYFSSTILNDTTKSTFGCDSIYGTININVTKVITTTLTTNVSSCKDVLFMGNTYNSSIVLRDTVRSYQGCDSIYNVININITPIVPITQTTNLSACNKLLYLGNTYFSSTILRDTIRSYQGCDSIYNVIIINITPIVPITQTTNLSACNKLLHLGNTYFSSTILIDTIRSYQGCDSIYKIVNITVTPVIATIQTINLSSCKSIIYSGITYNSSIVLRDTVRSYQGCDSIYKIVNIVINPNTASTQITNLSSCKGVSYLGITYNTTIHVKDTLRSYKGCDSIYRVGNIIITPIATITQTKSLYNCDDIVYLGNFYTTSTIIKDTIKSIFGCDSIFRITNLVIKRITPTVINTSLSSCDSVVYLGVTYNGSKTFIDTTKNFQGCDSVYKITTITIYAKPMITKPNNIYVLPNTAITLKISGSNNYDYLWYPSTYLDDATSQFPICTPTKDILYHIRVTSQDGCVDTVSQRVIVSKPLIIPNVFSPNGDAVNDTWVIDNINTYPRNTVQIFNRYGQLVLSSSPGSYKPWDGKYNGKDLPIGVYYYMILPDSNMQPITGSLTLLR